MTTYRLRFFSNGWDRWFTRFESTDLERIKFLEAELINLGFETTIERI